MRHGFEHLYVHVPLCAAKCAYCDFDSIAVEGDGSAVAAGFADALLAQADEPRIAESISDGGLATLYIGGGTPTLLDGDLGRLVEALGSRFGIEGAEVTVEANPESTSPALMCALSAAGVSRVSVGVQSFNDDVLTALGRLHDAAAALEAIRAAMDAGVRVSVDLMCGIPGQSMSVWRRSLRTAIESGAGHVSVYPLQLEDGTQMAEAVAAGALPAPDPEAAADMMLAARDILRQAGLFRYEVSNYAGPGEESRHNIAYWDGSSYLGLGPSAASMCDSSIARVLGIGEIAEGARARFTGVRDVHSFIESPTQAFREIEVLDARAAAAEDIMLALRLACGVEAETVTANGFDRVLEGLERDGLAERARGRWRTTERGWLLGNEVFGRVWEAR